VKRLYRIQNEEFVSAAFFVNRVPPPFRVYVGAVGSADWFAKRRRSTDTHPRWGHLGISISYTPIHSVTLYGFQVQLILFDA
jgi:hypothetical protein